MKLVGLESDLSLITPLSPPFVHSIRRLTAPLVITREKIKRNVFF